RRDRKAKAGADVARRLVERLEDSLVLIRGKSRSGVADLDKTQPIGANGREANRFRTSVRGAFGHQRLSGVAAQVLKHAQDVIRVRIDTETRRNLDILVDRSDSLGISARS